jgi:hypothetical protein
VNDREPDFPFNEPSVSDHELLSPLRGYPKRFHDSS